MSEDQDSERPSDAGVQDRIRLMERASLVDSLQDFSDYIAALARHVEQHPAVENPTTARYLEALAGWLDERPDPLSWTLIARALYVALIYE